MTQTNPNQAHRPAQAVHADALDVRVGGKRLRGGRGWGSVWGPAGVGCGGQPGRPGQQRVGEGGDEKRWSHTHPKQKTDICAGDRKFYAPFDVF